MEENVNGQIVADEVQNKEAEIVEAQNKVTEEVKEPKSCEGCVILEENEDFEKGLKVEPRKSKSYPEECGDCIIIKRNKRFHYNQSLRYIEDSKKFSIGNLGSLLFGMLFVGSLMFLGYIFLIQPKQQRLELSYDAEKAYLTLLEDERNRHLEYESLGVIKGSNNESYYLYEKDDEYYVGTSNYNNTSWNYDLKNDSEIAYVKVLEKLCGEDFQHIYQNVYMNLYQNQRYTETTIIPINYIKLTRCDYYDEDYDGYTYYNYCFFDGSNRVYFNI